MRIEPQTDGTSAHEAGDCVFLEKGRLRRKLTGRGERKGTREGKYGRIQMSSLYLREVSIRIAGQHKILELARIDLR